MRVEVELGGAVGALHIDAGFVSDGGILALFGRSGGGKTTIVNMIAGLTRPERGRIKIGDRLLFDSASGIDLPPHRRRVGYVFQDSRLFPHLTVRQNLLYGAWFSSADRTKSGLDRVVALLGIEGLLSRRPRNLSGGETQRIAIGRALLANPDILLLDEPLAALDGARKAEILPYIERLRDEARIPIVYVSHAVNEVARLASSLVLIADGRTVAQGSVSEILGRLDFAPFTEDGEAGTVVEAKVAAQDAENHLTLLDSAIGPITIPQLDEPIGTAIRVQIKARDVMISLRKPLDISALNVFEMAIAEMRAAPDGMVDVRLSRGDATLVSRVTGKSARLLDLAVGKPVFAIVKSVAFDRQRIGAWHRPG